METGIGRRMFVGSITAALPLMVTRGHLAAQAGGGAAHSHPTAETVDPILEHLARQLATNHNAMRRDPRGEHLRSFAAHLRTLTVYARQSGLDETVKSRVAALVARDGRYNVMYLEPDRKHLLSELRAYGAQPDEKLLNATVTLDYAARGAALDSLLQSGITGRLERLAAILDRMAPEIDRRSAGVLRASRQTDADYWAGYCKQLWSEYSEVQFLTGALCASALIPVIGIAFAPICIAHQLAATMLALVYGVYCWNVTP